MSKNLGSRPREQVAIAASLDSERRDPKRACFTRSSPFQQRCFYTGAWPHSNHNAVITPLNLTFFN